MTDDERELDRQLRELAADGNWLAARFLALPPDQRAEAMGAWVRALNAACGTILAALRAAFTEIGRQLGRQLAVAGDQLPKDRRPDHCWRCDSAPASTDVGLCVPCRTDLAP